MKKVFVLIIVFMLTMSFVKGNKKSINDSKFEELLLVGGVGVAKAEQIINNKPYKNKNDFVEKVDKVGNKSLKQLEIHYKF